MAAWRYKVSRLVLKKYFTRSLRSLVRYFSTLEEKFTFYIHLHLHFSYVSPRGHVKYVISSIYTTAFEDEKCSVCHKTASVP